MVFDGKGGRKLRCAELTGCAMRKLRGSSLTFILRSYTIMI